jgi:hypothetical protein
MIAFIWIILLGCIGLAYVSYGKAQHKIRPMLCGVALMVFPYFVSGLWLTLALGASLVLLPWFWRD